MIHSHGITATWIAPPSKELLSRSVIPMYVLNFGASNNSCFYPAEILRSGFQMCPDDSEPNLQSAPEWHIAYEWRELSIGRDWRNDAAQSLVQEESIAVSSPLLIADPCLLCAEGKNERTTAVARVLFCDTPHATIYKHRHRWQVTRLVLAIYCSSKEFNSVVEYLRNYGNVFFAPDCSDDSPALLDRAVLQSVSESPELCATI